MRKFEYSRRYVRAFSEEAEETFNAFGADGWQIIYISSSLMEGDKVFVWLMREIT